MSQKIFINNPNIDSHIAILSLILTYFWGFDWVWVWFGFLWVWFGFFKWDKIACLGHVDYLNNWTVKWGKFYPEFSCGHKYTSCHSSLERAKSAGTTRHTLITLITFHWQLQPEDFNPDGSLSG